MNFIEKINAFLKSDISNTETDLCELFKKYGSDKMSDWHNYSPLYFYLFNKYRNLNINLFEVGIFQGASLKAWRDFFIKGKIYAGDIDSRYFLVNEDIDCFYCDQDNSSAVLNLWNNPILKNTEFDIIIDDGKHEFESNMNFLNNSIHKVRNGGIYIVEDLTISTLCSFEKILPSLQNEYLLKSIGIVKIEHGKNLIDNNILIIKK